jgi:hypothetical protein
MRCEEQELGISYIYPIRHHAKSRIVHRDNIMPEGYPTPTLYPPKDSGDRHLHKKDHSRKPVAKAFPVDLRFTNLDNEYCSALTLPFGRQSRSSHGQRGAVPSLVRVRWLIVHLHRLLWIHIYVGCLLHSLYGHSRDASHIDGSAARAAARTASDNAVGVLGYGAAV